MADFIAVTLSTAGLVSLTSQIAEVEMVYLSFVRHAKEQTQDLL